MDTGRNKMSLGFLRNNPTSFTTLVKPNMNAISAPSRMYRFRGSQFSVPHQHEKSKRGSTKKASEVKVATCSAYVHHGCCLSKGQVVSTSRDRGKASLTYQITYFSWTRLVQLLLQLLLAQREHW